MICRTRAFSHLPAWLALLISLAVTTPALLAQTQVAPDLQKVFLDDPALPGSTVRLEFTLELPESAPGATTDITFSDDLTATLAGLVATGLPQNDICGTGSQLSGTGLLSFSGGALEPGALCTFTVNLTVPSNAAPGAYPNTTSNVTAMVGSNPVVGDPGSDTLELIGITFAKSFLDDPVLPGDPVTLEFTINNVDPNFAATSITFTDDLDLMLPGLVATGLPQNDVCGTGSQISGTSVISLTGGQLAAGASCTFAVTLTVPGGAAEGDYQNLTSTLTATVNGASVSSPAARDFLTVSTEVLLLRKSFTDDPVLPGGSVTLEFTLDNLANQAITAISFTDDLTAVLTGLVATGLPQNNVCGAGSSLTGTTLLTFSGGSLPAGGSCTFSVSLSVPASVGTLSVTNTTSGVTGTLGVTPVVGNPASDTLAVQLVAFSKSFTAPVLAGELATLTFTLENLSTTAAIADLTFTDNLAAVLPGLVAVGVPQNDVCGDTSQLTGTSLLSLTRAELQPGGSCSIVVQVQVPAGTAPGAYTNVTSDLLQNTTRVAPPAEAQLLVVTPPTFTKNFLSSNTLPGGVLSLEYTITNNTPLPLISLQFTDDFAAVLPGLSALDLPQTGICGGSSTLSGSGLLTFTGGSVAANFSCSILINLRVPISATPGNYTSTTGTLVYSASSLLAGRGLEAGTASDDFSVVPLLLTKAFPQTQVTAGNTATLRFTITNTDPGNAANAINFSDDLAAFVPGAVALGLPASDICGTGSLLSGGTVITLTGGRLTFGSCTFEVEVQIPPETAEGTYLNTTSPLTATVDGQTWTGSSGSGASAPLEVGGVLLNVPTLGGLGLLALIALLAGLALYRLRLG